MLLTAERYLAWGRGGTEPARTQPNACFAGIGEPYPPPFSEGSCSCSCRVSAARHD
jgi:hypothetical protein